MTKRGYKDIMLINTIDCESKKSTRFINCALDAL